MASKKKDGAPWYGDKPPGAKNKKKTYGAPWYGDKPPSAKGKTKDGAPWYGDKSPSAKLGAVKKMLKKKGM